MASTPISVSFFFFTFFCFSITHQQSAIFPSDLNALLQIKESLTDLPGSHFLSTWDFSSPNPCLSFSGIICTSVTAMVTATSPSSFSRISSLTLGTGLTDSPGLAGTLSPAIAQLTALEQLIVHNGAITGQIPPQLGDLHSILLISITNNLISGRIPDSLSKLQNLHTLDLSYNRLHGSIPASIAALPDLKVLVLTSNHLSGEIPDFRTQLIHLDLKNNAFTGPLPLLPASLRYLSASQNAMWGPLDNLLPLTDLEFLDLGMNSFSGSIPESLFGNNRLRCVFLQRNNLTGGIPSGDSYLVGSTVDLSHNGLSGTLSTALIRAESLYLNNNGFTGVVPVEYVRKVYGGSMKTLYLQHNYLSAFPVPSGSPLPLSASLCLSYNCMIPPVGPDACPASAGEQQRRPAYQCSSTFNKSATNG